MGRVPPATALRHVHTVDTVEEASKDESDESNTLPVRVGAGPPPVPKRLVKRIQSGEFIELAELLPDHMMEPTSSAIGSGKGEKRRHISTILEWLQCFTTYMSVVIASQPERSQDLLGYQSLIIEAKMQYEGSGWLSYDRRFRLNAAAQPDQKWSLMDGTLWNIAFAGAARADRCKLCFMLSHKSEECALAVSQQKQGFQQTGKHIPYSQQHGSGMPICRDWNFTPSASCSFQDCKFLHACVYCSQDTSLSGQQIQHKGMFCKRKSQQYPVPPFRFRPY